MPVRIFITPPLTSLELITSAKVTAQSGLVSLAKTMQVLPPTITGAITETNPNKEVCCGAIIATTPVDSGLEKLKCDDATGFTLLKTC